LNMTGCPALYEKKARIHSEKKPLKRLTLPWFVYRLVHGLGPATTSITLLFGMLIIVFFSNLAFNWKMTKVMAFSTFIFYCVCVAPPRPVLGNPSLAKENAVKTVNKAKNLRGEGRCPKMGLIEMTDGRLRVPTTLRHHVIYLRYIRAVMF